MLKRLSAKTVALGAAMVFSAFAVAPTMAQRGNDPRNDQRRSDPRDDQRRSDWDWDGNYQRLATINPGTFVTIRTTQSISADRRLDRTFPGVVEEDVWDDYGRLSVPAIPRGSGANLIVREARDGDLVLDLDSLDAHGQRYVVNAAPERIESNGRRDNGDTAAYAGGGALLGTIIGAIAGGGKGAAIGAAAGAATGLGVAYSGRSIRVPAGSVLTFRLDNGLTIRSNVRGTSGSDPRDRNR